jgi:hypothetical protein
VICSDRAEGSRAAVVISELPCIAEVAGVRSEGGGRALVFGSAAAGGQHSMNPRKFMQLVRGFCRSYLVEGPNARAMRVPGESMPSES